jgi:hypothetical protein
MMFGVARDLLFKRLWEIPAMQSDEQREFVVGQMREKGFDFGPGTSGSGRIHCIQIIDSALGQRGALQELADFLDWLDKAPKTRAFVSTVEVLLPADLLLLEERLLLFAELGPYVEQRDLMFHYLDALAGPYEDAVADPPPQFTDLESLVCELEQVMAAEPGHPLVQLTESIAERARKRRVAKLARKWSTLLAERIDEDALDAAAGAERRALEDRRQRGAGPAATRDGRPALVMKLERSGSGLTHFFLFTAWLYMGHAFVGKMCGSNTPMDLDGVRLSLLNALKSAFMVTRQLNPQERQVDLEFAVPRDMLCYPFDEWKFTDAEYALLAKQFVVVVRDLERQPGMQREMVRYAGWERKWERMTQNGYASPTEIALWITCGSEPSGPLQLYHQLQGDDGVSLGLTFPPRDSPHRLEIAEALDAGTPVVVWPRWCEDMGGRQRSEAASFAFRDEVCRRLADRPMTDLPAIALEIRQESYRADPSWAGLAVLWDDPWRWPEPSDFSLDAPGLLGETT